MSIVYGNWVESYAQLPVWLKHMQNHSPGSFFEILHDEYFAGNTLIREYRQFHRVFWTFKQCADAFNFCKPIIQIDGTHLYGRYRGTLLLATTQDGNGNVLPIAYGVEYRPHREDQKKNDSGREIEPSLPLIKFDFFQECLHISSPLRTLQASDHRNKFSSR